MVGQLEGSVLTAIALVMIVVLGALGTRPALLVGFAMPTSFLMSFLLFTMMGVTVSNIVMFGLILAVGMLVDGAIVVVEYADKRISEGTGPMHAYVEAAKRMFWPVVTSTATTLCAFLPMLFWPGVAGEFMGMLPITLIFVLSASLVVALVYLPVMGGVSGRFSRTLAARRTRCAALPWVLRAALVPVALLRLFVGAMMVLNPGLSLYAARNRVSSASCPASRSFLFSRLASVAMGAAHIERKPSGSTGATAARPLAGSSPLIAGNPVMPLVTIGRSGSSSSRPSAISAQTTTAWNSSSNPSPNRPSSMSAPAATSQPRRRRTRWCNVPRRSCRHIPASSRSSPLPARAGSTTTTAARRHPRTRSGRSSSRRSLGRTAPTVPTLTATWYRPARRPAGRHPRHQDRVSELAQGPASGKPVHLRLKGDDWEILLDATAQARAHFEETPGLTQIEDTLPLPGIDWQIDVDVEKAGRYGADVATVGAMVQLVTRGILLDTMRVDSSDEEIDIRVRLPEKDRRSLDARHAQGTHGRRPRAAVEFRHTQAGGQARRNQPDRPETLFRREGGCGPQPRQADRRR